MNLKFLIIDNIAMEKHNKFYFQLKLPQLMFDNKQINKCKWNLDTSKWADIFNLELVLFRRKYTCFCLYKIAGQKKNCGFLKRLVLCSIIPKMPQNVMHCIKFTSFPFTLPPHIIHKKIELNQPHQLHKSAFIHVLYRKLFLCKQLQTEKWVHFKI